MSKKFKMEYRPINEIKPYKNNPRKNDNAVQYVEASLREFDFTDPVIVDGKGELIAGHTRLKAAKKLGLKELPVIVRDDLTEDQIKALRIAHNKTGEFAEWDDELLSIELPEIEMDMEQFGFNMDDYLEEEQTDIIEDEVPELDEQSETTVKPGQIWKLGNHRLMCGNSTNSNHFKELMGGKVGRLCVTSPPYGVGMEYEEKGIGPWRETISGVIRNITKFCRIICWNIGDLFATESQFIEPTSMFSTEYMNENGFGLMYSRIWKKPGANFAGVNPYHLVSMKPVQEYEWILGYGKKDYEEDYAPIRDHMMAEFKKSGISKEKLAEITCAKFMYGHWFTTNQWVMIDYENYSKIQNYCINHGIDSFRDAYEKIRRKYDDLNIFQKTLSDEDRSSWGQWAIWEIEPVKSRDGHPAAFPVELPSRLIKMHSREGDIVIEPFGGSGTTLIACEQLGRINYSMELDPRYCDVIIKRWENLTGEKAELICEVKDA